MLFHIAPDTGSAPCCYDTIVSESRIAYYVGIEKGDLPSSVYYGPWRTFPDTCDFSFQETRPAGFTRSYEGRSVYEGAYKYGSTRLVPSWGGSMFEALMPALFVPEERWGPGSWAANHPLTVDAQIHHGLNVAGYDSVGLLALQQHRRRLPRVRRRRDRDGPGRLPVQPRPTRWSTAASTTRTARRPAAPDPPQSAYTNAIVTPHAAFLGLRWRPREALGALAALRALDAWTPLGFYDAVNVDTGDSRRARTSRSTRG